MSVELAFPASEFEDRLARIRARMKAAGADALIVLRPENIFWCSGYRAAYVANRVSELHCVVIPAVGEPRIVTRILEAETAKVQWTKEPKFYADHEDPYAVLVAMLKESGNEGKTIAIEERIVRLGQMKKMQKALPNAKFVDFSGAIENIAASPSPLETAAVRQAAKITNIGFMTGMKMIKEGLYPYQIIGKMHEAMYAAGQSDFDRALVALWSGPKGGRMHDPYTQEQIKKGDVVTIEIMGVDKHYRAGAQACSYVGGEAPENIKKTYKMVADMHEKAKAAVKAGVTAGEIFDAANAVYRAATGKDYYRRVGGSMGLTQFQLDLVKGRKDVLQPGVALLIQTLVDDPVLLTCASTVIVTETGYEAVTQPILSLEVPR